MTKKLAFIVALLASALVITLGVQQGIEQERHEFVYNLETEKTNKEYTFHYRATFIESDWVNTWHGQESKVKMLIAENVLLYSDLTEDSLSTVITKAVTNKYPNIDFILSSIEIKESDGTAKLQAPYKLGQYELY